MFSQINNTNQKVEFFSLFGGRLRYSLKKMKGVLTRAKDFITEVPKNTKIFLINDADNVLPVGLLLWSLSMLIGTNFVPKTQFFRKHDKTGLISSASIIMLTLPLSLRFVQKPWSHVPRNFGYVGSSAATALGLSLSLFLQRLKLYEVTMASLEVMICIALAILGLLMVLRPSTDLGLVGFLAGVVVSISFDLFGMKTSSLLILAISILLMCFKYWMEAPLSARNIDHHPSKVEFIYVAFNVTFILMTLTVSFVNIHKSRCQLPNIPVLILPGITTKIIIQFMKWVREELPSHPNQSQEDSNRSKLRSLLLNARLVLVTGSMFVLSFLPFCFSRKGSDWIWHLCLAVILLLYVLTSNIYSKTKFSSDEESGDHENRPVLMKAFHWIKFLPLGYTLLLLVDAGLDYFGFGSSLLLTMLKIQMVLSSVILHICMKFAYPILKTYRVLIVRPEVRSVYQITLDVYMICVFFCIFFAKLYSFSGT